VASGAGSVFPNNGNLIDYRKCFWVGIGLDT
jgi:hypothetical protein